MERQDDRKVGRQGGRRVGRQAGVGAGWQGGKERGRQSGRQEEIFLLNYNFCYLDSLPANRVRDLQ